MLNFVLGVVMGIFVGVTVALAYGAHLIRKADKKLKEKLQKATGDVPAPEGKPEKSTKDLRAAYAVVKPRLDRAAQISQEQAELMAQIDMPSKNSLHSKFKNGLVAEAKKLEEEKTELLRSILADGFDPEIKVQLDGEIRNMLLSEYLKTQGYDFSKPEAPTTNSEAPAEKTEEPTVRRVGNFFVIKGGKPETNH